MFIPGTLTVEYDDLDGGAVLKTDEGTEGAAICANVTLDNGILRATGPDFASADDGSSVGLRGRLTTHGSSVEAQLTARTGYASYGLYFDKQGSGRGDTWTMGLGKVTATAGHALSRYSYGLYVDYSSVNALELDGTQLTAMGGESDQYGSQGVFTGEEIIVKNGATVTATGGQVNSSYESVGFNAVSWLTVSGENSRVLGYGGTSVKGDSKGVRCGSRFTLTDGCVFGQGGVSCTSSRNVGVEFKRLIMESGKLEGISGSPDSSYQTWGGQFNAYGLYCTGAAKITGGELIGTANGTDRELDYSAYGFYGSDELAMSGGTLRATTGDTPNASSGTLAAISVVSNKSKTQLSGGTIYARAGISNDDRSYGMRILGTGSTLTMTNTEDAAQPLSLYVTGRNMALYATALADGGLLPEITASSAYDAEADTLTDGYTFSDKQYRKDGTAALSAAACLHSASDDTGLCTKCGKRVYEAVLLTDGAVIQRYAAAGEAFTAAQTEEHQGCTLRLLTDLIDDGEPLVHDPVVTITGGRFTLDLHNHTIAGKTSDDKEGVVTVTGGQLRIENGTLENLCTGNGSKAQALTLLGTGTHVTLANVTAIGATPPQRRHQRLRLCPRRRPSHHRERRVHRPGRRLLRLCSDGDAPRLHRRRHLPQRPVLLHPRDGGQRRHPSGHSEGGLCAGPRRRHAGGSGYRALLQPPLRHLYAQRRGTGGGPHPQRPQRTAGLLWLRLCLPPRRPDAGQLLYAAGLLPVRRLLRHSPQGPAHAHRQDHHR